MSLKKQLAIIIIVMVSLIASLVVLLVYVMQNREKAVPGVGLLNHTVTETQEPVTLLTESEMKEEIESRDTLPDSLTDTLGDRSMNGLSNGAFTNLDEYLMSLLDNYNPQDSADKINTLRADITYANIIVSEDMEPQDEWHFYNPEVLAAAIAYGSSKQKFDVMIDRNSDLLVAATSNINLRPVVLQQYEASELKSAINSMRSVSIINMAVYDMKIHGYECRFVAVTTDTDPTFQPYSITILNKNPYVKHMMTYDYIDGLKEIEPNLDVNMISMADNPEPDCPIMDTQEWLDYVISGRTWEDNMDITSRMSTEIVGPDETEDQEESSDETEDQEESSGEAGDIDKFETASDQ